MKIYVDSEGFNKVNIESEKRLVASFLEHDVQASLSGVDEYINACADVLSGKADEWEGTGNSHTVVITKDYVNIYNEYTAEKLDISSIREFCTYLNVWKNFLLKKKYFWIKVFPSLIKPLL